MHAKFVKVHVGNDQSLHGQYIRSVHIFVSGAISARHGTVWADLRRLSWGKPEPLGPICIMGHISVAMVSSTAFPYQTFIADFRDIAL